MTSLTSNTRKWTSPRTSKKFKATRKVVEELNHTAHEHAVVEIMCKEQNLKIEDIGPKEAAQFIAAGKERILGMQPIMNADQDKYGTLIKDYNRDYLSGTNKYPKTLQDTYNLLKGWNKNKKLGQQYLSKVGMSFKMVGEEDGEALINDGAKRPKCSRCGCNSHTVDKCTAKYRDDGTMLHNMGEV